MRILEKHLIIRSTFFLIQELHKKKETLESISKQLEKEPRNSELWAKKMLLLRLQRQDDSALKIFQDIPEEICDDLIYHIKGMCLMKTMENENYAELISCFKKALELNPLNIEARCSLATCFNRLDKHEEALNLWDDLIEIDPNWSEAWLGRSRCFYNLKDYSRALKLINSAIFCFETGICLSIMQEKPSVILAAYFKNRGDIYKNMGQKDLALNDYIRSIKTNPSNKLALSEVVKILIGKNRIKECIELSEKYLAKNPNDADWRIALMGMYGVEKNFTGIKKTFSEIKQILGNINEAHYIHYASALQTGNFNKEALKVLEAIVDSTNNHSIKAHCYQQILGIAKVLNDIALLKTYLKKARQDGLMFQL